MDETNRRKERRSSERAVFSLQENVTGNFRLFREGEEDRPFHARILNLSAGGLQFILRKEEEKGLAVGDRLLLKKIEGNDELSFCGDLEMKIKWILDADYLDHIGFGCQYQDIPDAVRERIDQFVHSGANQRDQKAD